MDILQESRESTEYSVISLTDLNDDCLHMIIQYLPFQDLLQLRYQCRSLNNIVCRQLRTFRKLAIFLNADRSIEELAEIHKRVSTTNRIEDVTFHGYSFDGPESRIPIGGVSVSFYPEADKTLLRHQDHFRFEDFIYLNTSLDSLDRKLMSLVLFLTNHMTLDKLALIINHEDFFGSIPAILEPVGTVKVLLLDLTYFLPPIYRTCPETDIADAISGLPRIESLYYFPSKTAGRVLYRRSIQDGPPFWPKLTSGQDFFEVMLRRLKVLHTGCLIFPSEEAFGIEELKLSEPKKNVLNSKFPELQILIVEDHRRFIYDLLKDKDSMPESLKVLKVDHQMYTGSVEHLNHLPNLLELHCQYIDVESFPRHIQSNQTIVRLFLSRHPDVELEEYGRVITPTLMDEYVAKCKECFWALRLLKIDRPEMVVEFPE